MRHLDLILYSTLLALGLIACDKGVDPEDNGGLKKIFSGNVRNVDLDYPYLYVAGSSEGLWRIDVSHDDFPIEYLPLLDTTRGIERVEDVDASGADIIAATWTGIWRSEDGGQTWFTSDSGIASVYGVEVVSRSPHNPNVALIHLRGSLLYRTENSGQSWLLFDTGVVHSGTEFIKWNPNIAGETWIYGIGDFDPFGFGPLYCTKNYGTEVKLKVDGNLLGDRYLSAVVSGLTFDHSDGNVLYLSVGNEDASYVYKSLDGGFNWHKVIADSTRVVIVFEQDPVDRGRFYIEDGRTIYISNDTLRTFQLLTEIPSPDGLGFVKEVLPDFEHNRLFVVGFGIFLVPLDE